MTLRSRWNTAKAWQSVTHDPFEGLRLPMLEKKEQPYYTAEQMQQIISRGAVSNAVLAGC
jgi:hypothetical protein